MNLYKEGFIKYYIIDTNNTVVAEAGNIGHDPPIQWPLSLNLHLFYRIY
jgi:hypothetical protein